MLSAAVKNMVREEFEHLSDVVYLNTGATSVPPKCVQQAYREEMEHFIQNHGIEKDKAAYQQEVRQGIAKLINADPGEIALTNNTTAGADAITMGYPWNPEKEVILFGEEHPSNIIDWVQREKEGKLKLKMVSPSGGGICADDIIGAINDKTQAIAVATVQYWDGARVDFKRLGEICKEKNILFIVDAIQTVGRLKVDVKADGIDFLSSGSHKGLLVRTGAGFLYCSNKIIDKVEPFHGSFQSTPELARIRPDNAERSIDWHKDARKFENGNHNDPGIYALTASLKLINGIGIENIEGEILHLQNKFYEYLGEKADKVSFKGDLPSGIIFIPFAESKRSEVSAILLKHKIIASLRADNVRMCINFHNTERDMEIAAKACEEILYL